MIKILTISLILFFTSCQNSGRTNNQTDSHTGFAIADSLYSVVEYDQETSYPFEEGEPTTLSISEIKEVEQILERAVRENNQIQKDNSKTETGFELKTDGYYRQYIPVINEKGEKEVWVNLSFREFSNERWKTELLPPVTDGGNCYFNLKVNLTKNSYSDLRINSYA